jgi:hypothetical protein
VNSGTWLSGPGPPPRLRPTRSADSADDLADRCDGGVAPRVFQAGQGFDPNSGTARDFGLREAGREALAPKVAAEGDASHHSRLATASTA